MRLRFARTDSFQRCWSAALLGVLILPGIASARNIIVAPLGGEFTSIAAGVGAAVAGDTITVWPGIYNEVVSFPRSGSATGFITLLGDPGAILDGTGKSGQGIIINSRNYIRVAGMTVQNFLSNTPMGIDVEGSSSFVELRDNLIHNIENPNGNAHGIAFYGTATAAMTNVVVDGNEIRNCKLGQSEALVLNGNIDGFTVSGNLVHDNDNIGIDFIGFEGTSATGVDQARNGVCVDNRIYNISSATNPTYGGDRSADGIYVDGGSGIVIERNRVDNCDIGIEVASEHGGKAASNITVRNNLISRGYQGNILMGGYAAARGNALNVIVVNNTTCQGTYGEIVLQYNCDQIRIENNILCAKPGQTYIANSGANNTNVTVANNLYYGASNTSPGSFPDARARFADPLLINPPLVDLHLQLGSPAIDMGIDLGVDAQGQPLSGAADFDGGPRVQGAAIDLGADETAIGTTSVIQPLSARRVDDAIILRWELPEAATESDPWLERAEGPSGDAWIRPATERAIEGRAVVEMDRSARLDRAYRYRLVAEVDGALRVVDTGVVVEAEAFALLGVEPNTGRGPFRIAYSLPQAASIRIEVLDVLGRIVASLTHGQQSAGMHAVAWDRTTRHGEHAPAGLYLVRYVYPGGQDVRRVALLK